MQYLSLELIKLFLPRLKPTSPPSPHNILFKFFLGLDPSEDSPLPPESEGFFPLSATTRLDIYKNPPYKKLRAQATEFLNNFETLAQPGVFLKSWPVH